MAAGRTLTFHMASPGPRAGQRSSTAWTHPSTPLQCAWCFWRRQWKTADAKEASEVMPTLSKRHQLFQDALLPTSILSMALHKPPVSCPHYQRCSPSYPFLQAPTLSCHILGEEFTISSFAGCLASITPRSVLSLKHHLPGRQARGCILWMGLSSENQHETCQRLKANISFVSFL